jgi:O-antigen/teichoic acid export membrane protein
MAAIVLVPLYTRTLSLADYGRLELILAVHTLIVIVAGMQIESSVAREYFETSASGTMGAMAWNAVVLTLCGTLGVAAVGVMAWVAGGLPSSIDGITLALVLALTFPVQLFGVQLVLLRFQGSTLRFAIMSFLDLTLCAAFSVWFIVGCHAGIGGALLGMLVGKTICMILAWSRTLGAAPPQLLNMGLAWRMLSYGVPALPAVLISWMQNAGSRLIMVTVLTLGDVAVAGVAVKVAAIYGFGVLSFRLAWEPYSMANLYAIGGDRSMYNRVLEWYIVAMFFAAGVAVLLSPYIVRLLAPADYLGAAKISAFFVLGQFWLGMTAVLVIGIHGSRRTALLLPVFGWGVAVTVVTLLVLAPSIGVVAVALGFMLGAVTSAALARHYSNKYFNTRFSARTLILTGLATGVLAIAWEWVSPWVAVRAPSVWNQVEVVVAGLVLLILLLAAIVKMSFEPKRLGEIRSVVHQLIGRLGCVH